MAMKYMCVCLQTKKAACSIKCMQLCTTLFFNYFIRQKSQCVHGYNAICICVTFIEKRPQRTSTMFIKAQAKNYYSFALCYDTFDQDSMFILPSKVSAEPTFPGLSLLLLVYYFLRKRGALCLCSQHPLLPVI